MLYLAADHAGFELKEKIKAHLEKREIPFEDEGAFEFDNTDDYPDFGYAAAKKVAQDPENHKAVLICGSGIGMSITANKVPGVYCAQVWQRDLAASARDHNQINAIALGSRYISEQEAILSVEEFLKKPEPAAERHFRRFEKVRKIEARQS